VTKKLLRLCVGRAPSRRLRRAGLHVEALEDRWCPAGLWQWSGPPAGGNWSNAAGGNWLHDAVAAPPNQYPGLPGAVNDVVRFNIAGAGPATLDKVIDPIETLEITGWANTLNLNFDLKVSGNGGDFKLTDPSRIRLVNGANLVLEDLGTPQQPTINSWTAGTITDDLRAISEVQVTGSILAITGSPGTLDVNMVIAHSDNPAGNPGKVTLDNMVDNLVLDGVSNEILVDGGGILQLSQQVAAFQQNAQGGIDSGPFHAAVGVAVEVLPGGVLTRESTPLPAVSDEVMIAGAVYNDGGSVQIGSSGNMLNITGVDGAGRSYWQSFDGASLTVASAGSNLAMRGTCRIDGGEVRVQALSGNFAVTTDALDSAGLVFGNARNTALTITESAGTPGEVGIGGSVTLAANTTLTMSFSGANSTADLLNVQGGALSLNGTLVLNSIDNPPQLPGGTLHCFTDSGASPSLVGVFVSIRNNVRPASYLYWVDQGNPNAYYWELAIQ
jgi:hypothetical protein